MNGKISRIIEEIISDSKIKQVDGESNRRKKKDYWKSLNWIQKSKVRQEYATMSK
jgi:hypothetical protein